MQTSNRLIYCKGGAPIRKAQYGGVSGYQDMNTFDPNAALSQGMSNIKPMDVAGAPGAKGLLGGMGGMASGVGNMASNLLFGGEKDYVAGAVDKGLDLGDQKEIEGAGSGLGTASDIVGGVGDIAKNIPGIGGLIAGIGTPIIQGALKMFQGNKKEDKLKMLAKANDERNTDAAQATALGGLGQSGGLIYRRPTDRIISFISGGPSYEKGGKAPELTWSHSFNIEFKESTLEKKAVSVKVFKRGGKFNDPDKTNVIVAGSRHHEKNALGDKGVPVIDKSGKKVFEVERGELVLTKDVTTKLEKFFENYKLLEEDEDKSHKILSTLGGYFKKEIKENLHNYEENVV